MNKRAIGDKKEDEAVKHIEKNGYKILERNYYGEYGEIDIIGIIEDIIVFFEVKYRRNSKYGYAEEAVNPKKQKKIFLTALNYIEKIGEKDKNMRFDVLAFNKDELNWIKNSFWGDEIGF